MMFEMIIGAVYYAMVIGKLIACKLFYEKG